MNRLGVLGRLIPEFGRLFCMVQHDAYHIYTVDEHSLIGIRELERLRGGAFAEASPLLTQVMRECDRPELLYLAMMFTTSARGTAATTTSAARSWSWRSRIACS
jgi:[protein-PII] uridylyltransferase